MRVFCVRYLLAISVAVVLCGCAAPSLREAQEHFNAAAEIEIRAMNESLLSDNVSARPGDSIAALNEYRLAYATASEAIAEKSGDLRRENLLGATYVLEAMALWRVSDLQGDPLQDEERTSTSARAAPAPSDGTAPADAANARQQLLMLLDEIEKLHEDGGIHLGTRDKVLHRALYGFYDHDGGRAAEDYETAESWFESALERLAESVADGVPAQHPVRVYVGSAQLRTLGAWNQAIRAEFEACKLDPARDDPDCKRRQRERQKKVNSRTEDVVCGLELFWADNQALRDQLTALTSVIGLPSAMEACRS